MDSKSKSKHMVIGFQIYAQRKVLFICIILNEIEQFSMRMDPPRQHDNAMNLFNSELTIIMEFELTNI